MTETITIPDSARLASALRVATAMNEEFADAEVVLKERIASLEEDNTWARGLVVQTVATIAALTKERDRIRNDRDRIRAEFADFYARMMMGERASAIRPDLAASRPRQLPTTRHALISAPEGAACH